MRVIHVGYAHSIHDTRIMKKECSTLSKAGYEVFYVTSDKNSSGPDPEEVGQVIIPLKKQKGIRLFFFYMDLLRTLKKLNGDVYHIHEQLLLPLANWLKRKKKYVIYDMHEMPIELSALNERKKNFVWKLFMRALSSYEKKTIGRVDYNITVTPGLQKYLSKLTKYTLLITNYPIVENAQNPPSFKENKFCFTGGISKQYNIESILSAMGNIPEIHLEMAGVCDKSYLEILQQHPSWSRVHYHGQVPYEIVKDIQESSLAGLAVLSSPDIPQEGSFGIIKFFEYMSRGIPVICSNYTNWVNIIEKWKCGILVDPKKTEEIEAAIRKLASDRELCAEMGRRAFQAASEEYNWNNQALKLIDLYKHIENTLTMKR